MYCFEQSVYQCVQSLFTPFFGIFSLFFLSKSLFLGSLFLLFYLSFEFYLCLFQLLLQLLIICFSLFYFVFKHFLLSGVRGKSSKIIFEHLQSVTTRYSLILVHFCSNSKQNYMNECIHLIKCSIVLLRTRYSLNSSTFFCCL